MHIRADSIITSDSGALVQDSQTHIDLVLPRESEYAQPALVCYILSRYLMHPIINSPYLPSPA